MAEPGILQVGVVIDGRDARRWHATTISTIEELSFCEVTVFTVDRGPRPRPGPREALRHLLYGVYVWADRRWFGRDGDPLARVPVERCAGPGTRRVELGSNPPEAIGAERLDVVLSLVPDVAAERLAGCARFGAWSLHAGDGRGRAGATQLFWQMTSSPPSRCVPTLRRRASVSFTARWCAPTRCRSPAAAAWPPAGRRSCPRGACATCTNEDGVRSPARRRRSPAERPGRDRPTR
jgi:hypothetical protein